MNPETGKYLIFIGAIIFIAGIIIYFFTRSCIGLGFCGAICGLRKIASSFISQS
jgi:hypothetical protein